MDLAVLVMDLGEAPGRSSGSFRRCAVLPSRYRRTSPKDIVVLRREFAHFLAIAKGSVMEVETLIMLTVQLSYVPKPVRLLSDGRDRQMLAIVAAAPGACPIPRTS
jgi:hypothetical protein